MRVKKEQIAHQVWLMALLLAGLTWEWSFATASSPAERGRRIEALIAEYEQEISTPYVSVTEFMNWPKDRLPVLVDVRTDNEREVSIIPGAISQAQYDRDRAAFGNRPVMVYCTIGHRSAYVVRELRKEGVEAKNLRGSLLMWVHQGGALVDPAGRTTNHVHTFAEKWDVLPPGLTSVYERGFWQELWFGIRQLWE